MTKRECALALLQVGQLAYLAYERERNALFWQDISPSNSISSRKCVNGESFTWARSMEPVGEWNVSLCI